MRNTLGVRARLTLAYALALALALLAFAAVTLGLVDTLQRRDLDAQLLAAAQADRAIADVTRGRLVVDALDREQFGKIAATRVSSAILDPRGRIVTSNVVDVPAAVVGFATRAAEAASVTLTLNGDRVRLRVEPLEARRERAGTIVVWRDIESIGKLDARLALLFALAIPFAVGAAMLMGGAIARRGLAPLERMARIAAGIEARDLTQRLGLPPRDDELGRLAATFDRMLERLQSAFERERRFTGDASHELRAPLSIILAETEYALVRERRPDEYRAALETIALEAETLESLTRSLLAAARAERDATTHVESIDLAEVAERAADRLARVAAARGLTVERRIAAGALVLADPDELERALAAVLHNAVKFARHRVELASAVESARVRVAVADDGGGFSPAALAHGFERFWRDPAGNTDGSGLGLALARAIVDRYGGTIELANGAAGGGFVTLTFPAQPPGGASNS